MKLKTLKDMGKPVTYTDSTTTWEIIQDNLRQEAIKWVKDMQQNPGSHTVYEKTPYETIEWIKHFFNLTEEDLKNG